MQTYVCLTAQPLYANISMLFQQQKLMPHARLWCHFVGTDKNVCNQDVFHVIVQLFFFSLPVVDLMVEVIVEAMGGIQSSSWE